MKSIDILIEALCCKPDNLTAEQTNQHYDEGLEVLKNTCAEKKYNFNQYKVEYTKKYWMKQ